MCVKKSIVLFLFFSFCLSYYAEDYLLDATSEYFNGIEWTEGASLDFSTLPSPYSIGEVGIDSVFLYADTTRDDTIFPEIGELGVLDYSATPYPLLESMQLFCNSIINKKMSQSLPLASRPFLAPLFAYRFSHMQNIGRIDYVFFSTPTFSSQRATSKFRLNYTVNGRPKYRLMEGVFLNIDGKWALESFDFIGWEVDDSTN